MKSFTFGSDPELMLVKNGTFYSAIGIVPGDKDRRHKISGHEYYYDNVLAECAIKPGQNKKDVLAQMRDCLQKYARLVAPYKLVPQASHDFPKLALQHRSAREIDCSPECCAYTMKQIKHADNMLAKTTLRSAGGHIHLGTGLAKELYGCEFIVRMLDLFLGLPSIYIDHDKTAKNRKKLYGQAGRFRRPKHGVEYRTLGNFWIGSPKLVGLIYDLAKFTLEFVERKKHLELWTVDYSRLSDDKARLQPNFKTSDCHQCHGYDAEALRAAIDIMDKRRGNTFLNFIGNLLPARLNDAIADASVPIQYDMYKEWGIEV